MTEQNSVEVLPKEELQEQKDPRVQRKVEYEERGIEGGRLHR